MPGKKKCTASGNKLGPGLTRQQRYYRNGGREKRAAWRARPKIRKRLAARTKRWKKLNPEKVKDYLARTRDIRRVQGTQTNWRRKGITHVSRPCPKFCERPWCKRRARHLDHDHKTGRFRGWLCMQCNTALGKLDDNIRGALGAVIYLRRAA